MTKLVWMSDLHFAQAGELLGHDPRLRLQAAIDHINAHHSDAEVCVISGDMVNCGTREDYEGVKAMLAGLSMPYLPMVGNHDTRALFREILPLPATAMPDFVQYTHAAQDHVIICLDTLKEGSDAGALCGARRDWLRHKLEAAGTSPTLLFMHHPPIPLGLPMQDADRLEDGESFAQLISAFPNVAYLCIGHVHRPISGTFGNVPFSTMSSVLFQAPPPKPDWDWSTFKPAKEAPNIGVIHLNAGSVTLQYEPFCTVETGVTLA